jgi:hypothetical protein
MQPSRKNTIGVFLTILSLTSISLNAQQSLYRSDTLNFSIQLRYLIFSFGGGVEVPFRQHSFGLQIGYNFIPNVNTDFNTVKVAAIEYKKYVNRTFYYGSYVLYNQTDYAFPGEASKWNGQWSESQSANLGVLLGRKAYRGRRIYLELFGGMHFGWKWGQLKWTNDIGQGQSEYYLTDANKANAGVRLGFSFGFHLAKKKINVAHS